MASASGATPKKTPPGRSICEHMLEAVNTCTSRATTCTCLCHVHVHAHAHVHVRVPLHVPDAVDHLRTAAASRSTAEATASEEKAYLGLG
eukprot:scaffold61518_cov45-Phaeocystis_antarctica.AAC.2